MAETTTENNTSAALANPVSLTSQAHGGLRIQSVGSAEHISRNHFAKIYTPEFSKAGTDYPIIFVKDPETGVFYAAGMWGLQPGENLFVEGDRWVGGYFPASVRCYPFAVQPDPENTDRLFIGIYEKAHVVNKEEGNLMFNEDGTETEWMAGVKEFLVRVFQQEEMTKQFVKKLDEIGLLSSQTLTIRNPDGSTAHDVSGFYVVDREKLDKLSDEDYLALRKNGALEVIYHHLMSLDALEKLLRKKNGQGNDQAADGSEPMAGGASQAPV